MVPMTKADEEIRQGKRFAFGENWRAFLATLDEERIATAQRSLQAMLGCERLDGKTVLDIGSGSGLFSLALRRLGARVRSFDFDPASVACTAELRTRYFPDDGDWLVEQGSVLDASYLATLGTFDLVYSWGVLHHTGAMWTAIDHAATRVTGGGTLFIAIYNDRGRSSRNWARIKRIYCQGRLGRSVVSAVFIPYFALRTLASCVVRRQNIFARYRQDRGMSIVHDWHDWLGGYPYEYATPEAIFSFLRDRSFALQELRTTPWLNNNEFVFTRQAAG